MIWDQVKLGDLINSAKGSLASGPFGSSIGSRFFVEEGVPVIRGNNLTKGQGKYIDGGYVFLTESKAAEFPNCVAVEDDIIFTAAGSIGQVGIIPRDRKFERYIISNKQIRARLDTDKALPTFVYYWLSSPRMVRFIESQNNGGAVPLLNLGLVRRLPVPMPPITTQEKIISTLSAYDDLIENNRRRIALLEEAARQLYKEWFVRFRFPGHEHVPIVDGVPEGWEEHKLGTLLARVKRPGKIKKDDYLPEGPIPCVDQSKDFIGGYTDLEDAKIAEPLPLIVFGDHTRILKFVDFPFACGADGTQLLSPNDERLPSTFFYFSIDAIDLSNYFYARHFKFLKDQIVRIPFPHLVDQFEEFSSKNMKLAASLRETNHQLSKARDILLPKLMSGEVAV